MQDCSALHLFNSFVISQEGDMLQRQHVFVVIGHLVVAFMPHIDEVIAVNQTDELFVQLIIDVYIRNVPLSNQQPSYLI